MGHVIYLLYIRSVGLYGSLEHGRRRLPAVWFTFERKSNVTG